MQKQKRRGSVLVLTAMSMVVLLGVGALAVDYSVLLSDKNRLQRASDAAALSGGAYLKRTSDDAFNRSKAIQEALRVARANGLTIADPPTTASAATDEMTAADITFSDNDTRIRVMSHRVRELFFARVLGLARGNIKARATAQIGGISTPQVVPIAITPTSKAKYEKDGLPHNFTLIRPQDTAFKPDYSGTTPIDPFQLFDLRVGSAKSAPQMQRQLQGDPNPPVAVDVGDKLTNFALSLSALIGPAKDGAAFRFEKAAVAPWFDPLTGLASPSWATIGFRLPEILAGTTPEGNPRLMSFVVIEETSAPVSNYDSTVLSFAPIYFHSIQDSGTTVTITATFLPEGVVAPIRPITLIE